MKNFKFFTLFFLALTLSTTGQAQWLDDASGNKKAVELSNQAIDCMTNLEYGRAQGFAMAALSIDPKATSAKIVMSWTSGGEVSDELMEEVSAMKMSSSEKIWYDILQKPGAEHALMAKKSGSTEPLITYIAAYESYDYGLCHNADLIALAKRVEVIGDDQIADSAARVDLKHKDGQLRSQSFDLLSPIDPVLLGTRLLAKAKALIGDDRANDLWAMTNALEQVSASDLAAKLQG